MKRLLFALSIVILTACGSSKKALQNGRFDEAIQRSVKSLLKNPEKEKEINILSQAYVKAEQIDLERIQFLKAGSEESAWEEIFNRYNDLQSRQTLVSSLPHTTLQAIQFSPKDFSRDLFAAKKRASDFLYQRALAELSAGNRYKARDAFYDLQKVKRYSPDYKDVDRRLDEAAYKGTNQVLFKIRNGANVIIPRELEAEVLKISMKDLNVDWLNYDTKAIAGTTYDYYIILTIKSIFVSPEQVKETEFTDEKEIQDGFKYQLDKKGNVAKDSAGNDIKLPIYKKITCKVIETRQWKTSLIGGSLDYLDARSNQLIKTVPISAEMVFENRAATAVGDKEALKQESRKWLGNRIVPFPTNEQMVFDGGAVLKDKVKETLWNNRKWLKE
ncbi:MAG: hypothetical protein PHV20_06990 [Bacteroidales bacterium]|nr:hypothetical protein [Bacteroidales bacterium]